MLAAGILQVLLAATLLTSVAAGLRGVLNAHKRFLSPALGQVLQIAASLGLLFVFADRFGIFALVIGYVVGAVVYLAVLAHAARPLALRFRMRIAEARPIVSDITRLALPFLVIGAADHVNHLADRFFASGLAPGAISVLGYGLRFKILLLGVIPAAVTVPAYTFLSEEFARNDADGARQVVAASVRLIALASLPLIVSFLILREEVVALILEHGRFGHGDTMAVSAVLFHYGPALVTWAFSYLLIHVAFALRRTALCVGVILVEIAVNIVLDALLVVPMGVNGLALATSVAVTISNLVLWTILGGQLGGGWVRETCVFGAKLLAGAASLGVVVWSLGLVWNLLVEKPSTPLGAIGILSICGGGAAVELAVLKAQGIEEMERLSRVIKEKFGLTQK